MPADQQFKAVPTSEAFGTEVQRSRLERCGHFLMHHDSSGQRLICGVTPRNWCEIWVALILLWAITTLFWYLMYLACLVGKIDALWGFFVAFVLFVIMWIYLIYQGDQELKAEEEAERHAMFLATRSRQPNESIP